jgi:uncharacterized membrane protein
VLARKNAIETTAQGGTVIRTPFDETKETALREALARHTSQTSSAD